MRRFFPYTLEKNVSQTVQRFGFIRLTLIPRRRKGMQKGPRSAIGTCMFCQQLLQMVDCAVVMESSDDYGESRWVRQPKPTLCSPQRTRTLTLARGLQINHPRRGL